MIPPGRMPYMTATADLGELALVADEHRSALERAIVAAHEDGLGPAQIAAETNRSRSQIYTILRRHGVELDSERGRELVAHRYNGERETTSDEETSSMMDWISGRTPPAPDPEPQLFDPPADGPEEDPISILEFIDKQREKAREMGLRD